MNRLMLFTVSFLVLFNCAESAKILAVFSLCSYSHHTLGITLMKELVNRGHEVTFITCFPQNDTIKNLKYVSVADTQVKDIDDKKKNFFDLGRMSYYGQLKWVTEFGLSYSELTLRNKNVQELLKSTEQFDLFIFEHFVNEAFAIFGHRFNCPTIIFAPGPASEFNSHLVGNPTLAAYVPSILANFDSKMSFLERVKNLYYSLISQYFIHFVYVPSQNELLKSILPDAPDLTSILYNNSLMLATSHISFTDPVPLQPNIKEIGGFHVQPPKPLPKDIQQYLDNAKEGVVLFSMGSNLKSSAFSEDKKRAILKAFSNIKQKVLWKFEADLPEKPSNVKIMKWIPQSDILAHPNVIAFISHGGLLGTIEAIYHGVPILGLHVFWDQAKNIEDAARKGYAINLGFEQLNEESFNWALNELLNNPKYRENAKRRSLIMHDQPVKQLDEAAFWIEYVLRHRGAPHLRPASLDLTWYQAYFIDFFLLVFVIFVVIFSLAYLIIMTSLKMNKKVVSKSKKNK